MKMICYQIKKYKPSFFIINDQNVYTKVKKNLKIIEQKF